MATFYTNAPMAFGADDEVTDVYTAQKFPLGCYREEDGKGYRFVQFDNGSGNVASVAGGLAYKLADTGTFVVTMDVSDTLPNKVFGVFTAVIADAGYGWVQTRGACTVNTNGDDDIAEGDAIIPSAAGDGTCDSTAAGTAPIRRVVGFALAVDVDAANTVVTELELE